MPDLQALQMYLNVEFYKTIKTCSNKLEVIILKIKVQTVISYI